MFAFHRIETKESLPLAGTSYLKGDGGVRLANQIDGFHLLQGALNALVLFKRRARLSQARKKEGTQSSI